MPAVLALQSMPVRVLLHNFDDVNPSASLAHT